jgi:hypothetical protein
LFLKMVAECDVHIYCTPHGCHLFQDAAHVLLSPTELVVTQISKRE